MCVCMYVYMYVCMYVCMYIVVVKLCCVNLKKNFISFERDVKCMCCNMYFILKWMEY